RGPTARPARASSRAVPLSRSERTRRFAVAVLITRVAEPWTVRSVLAWMASDFSARGIESARLDAELLVAHALATTRVGFYMDLDRPLTPQELESIRALVQRRRGTEPVAYIVGTK